MAASVVVVVVGAAGVIDESLAGVVAAAAVAVFGSFVAVLVVVGVSVFTSAGCGDFGFLDNSLLLCREITATTNKTNCEPNKKERSNDHITKS